MSNETEPVTEPTRNEALAIVACLFIGILGLIILSLVPSDQEQAQSKARIIQKQIDMMTKAQEDIEAMKQQWRYYLEATTNNESKTK
jgi:predicted PurR-regulated permease PerM